MSAGAGAELVHATRATCHGRHCHSPPCLTNTFVFQKSPANFPGCGDGNQLGCRRLKQKKDAGPLMRWAEGPAAFPGSLRFRRAARKLDRRVFGSSQRHQRSPSLRAHTPCQRSFSPSGISEVYRTPHDGWSGVRKKLVISVPPTGCLTLVNATLFAPINSLINL
jgi:hypothetical protein